MNNMHSNHILKEFDPIVQVHATVRTKMFSRLLRNGVSCQTGHNQTA